MMRALMLWALRAYQLVLSPWMGGQCRYWPTCSDYSQQAIEQHGALRGAWLTLGRLLRCHPYGRGGVDPVPTTFPTAFPKTFHWPCRHGNGCTHQTERTD